MKFLHVPFLAVVTLLSCATSSVLADTSGIDKRYRISPETTPPAIDGVLDDAAWKNAPRVNDLFQLSPDLYAPPTYPTEVQFTYDRHHLYVAARIRMPVEEIRATQLMQGRPIAADDRFSILIDTFRERRNGYYFQCNPNGVRRDGLKGNDYWIEEWDAVWNCAAQIVDDGWTLEMEIPFKSISFDPAIDTWGLNFYLYTPGLQEFDGWKAVSSDDGPAMAGDLVGIRDIEQGAGFDAVPSLVAKRSRNHVTGRTETSLEPSLNAFYKLTSSMTAALTLNTDFSATEVDDRQVNFTRFSLFIPEKRDFFLQDADIFKFAGFRRNAIPFFSRRIGLGESGQALEIDGGLKLTGRTSGGINVGALAVRQDSLGGGNKTDLLIGRATMNVFDESSLGFIVTDGSPDASLDNSLAGIDFTYLDTAVLGDQTFKAMATYQDTDTTGLSGEDNSWNLNLSWPNRAVNAMLDIKEVGRNYNPELGFVNRRNIRDHYGFVAVSWYPETSAIRYWGHSMTARLTDDLDAGLVTRIFDLSPIYLEFGDSTYVEAAWQGNHESVLAGFTLPGGIPVAPGDYDFDRYSLDISTGNQRTLSGAVRFEDGDFYDGRNRVMDASAEWRVSRHLFVATGVSVSKLDFGNDAFISRLFRLKADIAFDGKWSWLNLVQFDNDSNELGINSRLRWMPEAGQEFYFVINHNMQRNPDDGFRTTSNEAVLKLNYLLRF